MKRAIVSVAVAGLGMAANNDELFLKGIEHTAGNVGHFVANHQGQIEGAINTGINVAKYVGEIAGDSELFDIKKTLGKVGKYIEKHPEAFRIGIMADSDDELFLKGIEHAAGNVGHFVANHQKEIEGAINTGITVAKYVGEIAGDSELFNIKTTLGKFGDYVKKHPEAFRIGIMANANDSDDELFLKGIEHAAGNVGHFVANHQKEIEGAINTGITVAKYVGEIAGETELFSIKEALNQVGAFVNEKKQAIEGITFGSEKKKAIEESDTFVNEKKKAVEDGITIGGEQKKAIEDGITISGEQKKAIEDGVTAGGAISSIKKTLEQVGTFVSEKKKAIEGINIFGDATNNQLNVEGAFLGF